MFGAAVNQGLVSWRTVNGGDEQTRVKLSRREQCSLEDVCGEDLRVKSVSCAEDSLIGGQQSRPLCWLPPRTCCSFFIFGDGDLDRRRLLHMIFEEAIGGNVDSASDMQGLAGRRTSMSSWSDLFIVRPNRRAGSEEISVTESDGGARDWKFSGLLSHVRGRVAGRIREMREEQDIVKVPGKYSGQTLAPFTASFSPLESVGSNGGG